MANAALLVGVAVFILIEAIDRLGTGETVPGVPMIVVALTGVAANVVVAMLLRSHSAGSLAVKGAYMEVVADIVGSLGVLIAGIVTVTTHWPYADVVVAVLVAIWVLPARSRSRARRCGFCRDIARPHRRRGVAGGAARRRRCHRSARFACVDVVAGQGHVHRALDQRRRFRPGARRRP